MRTTTKTTLPVVKPQLKTPISYYGGKQSMLKEILPLIPEHRIYTEVFFGGGAVFWAKQPAEVEVINDLNAEVVNFYKQAKSNFLELKKLIDVSLHSREIYADAMHIYKRPHLFSELYRAWAFWVATNQGFSTMIGNWGYTNNNKSPLKNTNKRIAFDEKICKRLDTVQIECNDAIKILKARNKEDAFHYIDPPYIEVHQGHYAGYLRSDFEDLLKTCEQIKGKFLLSTYPTDILAEYSKKNGWYTVEISKPLCASKVNDGAKRKYKIEVLTANYPI